MFSLSKLYASVKLIFAEDAVPTETRVAGNLDQESRPFHNWDGE
jgi:hypothetical protein